MSRYIAFALVLLVAVPLLAGCGNEAMPTATDTGFEKKGPVLPPPDDDNEHLARMQQAFEDLDFNPVTIHVDLGGGTFSGTSTTYTSATPIKVTIPGNSALAGIPADIEIYVPDAPASGYLLTPANSILFQVGKVPEDIAGILVHLPLMSWNDTADYSGDFSNYRLAVTPEGFPYREGINLFTIPNWPPLDPNTVVYVTSEIPPGTDDPGAILDQVLEPTQPGGGL